jgi:hypothetical protein
MEWMKAHEYLAVWLSLPLMTVIAIFQGIKGEGKPVGMARMTMYFGFLVCLGAVFTPTIDDSARVFAGLLGFVLAILVALHAWEEVKAAHPGRTPYKFN